MDDIPISEEKLLELEEKRKMDRESSFNEMEKIFTPVRKFDLTYGGLEQADDSRRQYDERDYSTHRRHEFPHVHHPLKSLHKKKKKRKEHKMKRKKKKKHEIKFTPVLPGVEEKNEENDEDDDDEYDYSFESDESSVGTVEDDIPPILNVESTPTMSTRLKVLDEGHGSAGSSVPIISELDTKRSGAAAAAGISQLPKRPLEVGESPSRPPRPAKTKVTVTPTPEDGLDLSEEQRMLMHGASLDDTSPTRSRSFARVTQRDEEPQQLQFLNRKMSEGLPTVKSSESMKSNPDHSVAAQVFQCQAWDEPEISKMFDDTDENSPLVSRPLSFVQDSEPETDNNGKVTFHLGGDEESATDNESVIPVIQVEYQQQQQQQQQKQQTPEKESTPEISSASELTDSEGKHKHKRKKHKSKYRYHEHFNVEDLLERQRSGSEVFDTTLKRVPTEPDEAALLNLSVLDDLKSHRFEDVRGIRRHKIRHSAMASIVSIGKMSRKGSLTPGKHFDHSPHEIFVELDELKLGPRQEWEWKEKARWIKFEEDVEEGAERWGKPHVASLSFHSLLDLRRCIEQGAVMLDLEGSDLSTITHKITEQLIITDQITENERSSVLRTLLLKHRHVKERSVIPSSLSSQNLRGLDRKDSSTSSYRHLNLPDGTHGSSTVPSGLAATATNRGSSPSSLFNPITALKKNHSTSILKHSSSGNMKPTHRSQQRRASDVTFSKLDGTRVDIDNNTEEDIGINLTQSQISLSRRQSIFQRALHRADHDLEIMKKIPKGSEATTVLVGAVDFLKKPAMAFVRLSEGQMLENLTEVPLPVRFVFVLLGPESESIDYHEIGRSISTLMSNKAFHDTAYRADERQDLLDAINEFLDDSVVLPPGDWDQKTLLPIMDMKKKQQKQKQQFIRRRKGVQLTKDANRKSEDDVDQLVKKEEKTYEDPLRRTGRIFGGLINEVKRRYPVYLSDIKDGINVQCFAAFIFIYFAALSPAITFGGLLGEKTDNWMGVCEMLICTSICGIIFSLLSGQPLLIIGATGPVLVFEEALFSFCRSNQIEFLPMRSWVGLWVAFITVIVVALEGSCLVRFITRFTEEVFAFLISLIFIYEVFKKIYVVFMDHPLMEYYPPPDWIPVPTSNPVVSFNGSTGDLIHTSTDNPSVTDVYANATHHHNDTSKTYTKAKVLNQPNTALLSVILTFGTFFIAHFMKNFRNSHFLGRNARRALGDFGILIAIVIMTLVDYLIKDTYTKKLDIPDGMKPTLSTDRGWFINPLGMKETLPVHVVFASIIPAVLIFILIFLETEICGVIVEKRGRILKKGTGFHVDMLLIGLSAAASGLFGLPFMAAASVRSITHLSSLSVFSRTHAPGEKPKLIEVKEQRMTSLFVHILIGVSVLMGPVLRAIPMAVLFGVFLYMGIASLNGIQFYDRLKLLLMPVKHHPDSAYARQVKTWRMNLYTSIQLIFLAILWAVKSTVAALGFPFVLILLVPIRLIVLNRCFSEKELNALDGVEEDSVEQEDEPDFYEQAHMPQ
ncbi:anion exchange protein 3-like isoform X2 [Tubulanus polymorphus]|uniref:anion exchange protein 3-like isoform X2 n=1 Tax=Tubulanus polymorphus TaxID=672921 RepID=UPI003DA309AD